MGRPPWFTDSELVCLAVAQAVLGFRSEARWLAHLRSMFPHLPQRPGYNKRLRAALPLLKQVIRLLAHNTDFWFDNMWIADSTPIECGRSRSPVRRSDLAGWAGYGYCASPLAVLGAATAPGVHPGWHAHRMGTCYPQGGRARGPGRDAGP
jgi:hypothetical protein